ncbi:NAD-dependent epimerase/dehydratase family protein [Alphaproteobacteria bacterium]|nr:NAD-dependent epimerase/dehydratase family protein [Alphaproteobacteria bacterium]
MGQVLITGGAGFVGQNLTKSIIEETEHQVLVVDNNSANTIDQIKDWDVNIEQVDILEADKLNRLMKHCDFVVHLAASTNVTASNKTPTETIQNNIIGTYNLLSASKDNDIKHFINASTGGALLGDVDGPVNETMAPNPQSIYGATKMAAEGLCAAFMGSFNLSTLSLRFSNIFGERSAHKESVVAAYIKSIMYDREFQIYGDGSQIRDYYYVQDLVKMITACLEKRPTGVIQLGSGTPTTLNSLLDTINQIADSSSQTIKRESMRAGEVHTTWCDISKAVDVMDSYPNTPLPEALANTYDWFRANNSQ